ncbi:MAG: TlpA disulfide reductase family protein [Planctomycetaceae bacterium]
MKSTIAILLLVGFQARASAQEVASGEAELVKLKEKYDQLMEEWWQQEEGIEDKKQRQQHFEQSYPAHVMTEPFFELEANYRGTNVGLSCLHQLISAVGAISLKDDPANRAAGRALQLVTEHYLDHPDIDLILSWTTNRDIDGCDRFLKELANSPRRELRGQARLCRAQRFKTDIFGIDIRQTLMALMEGDSEYDERRNALRGFQQRKASINIEATRREALALLDEVDAEYADINMPRRTPYGPLLIGKPDPNVDQILNYPRGTLGQASKSLRSALVDFGIGRTPPDFAAIDVDGTPRRLHDYRGKVLVLMFSFKGCGPCEAMYPHLRELLTKHSPDEFAILGIMRDEEIEPVREAIKDGTITWPCIHDGPDGPIISRWNVTSFPGIYVLDRAGVIRYMGPREKLLERAIANSMKLASEMP